MMKKRVIKLSNKGKEVSLVLFAVFFLVSLINFVGAAQISYDGFESGEMGGWTLSANSGANNWKA